MNPVNTYRITFQRKRDFLVWTPQHVVNFYVSAAKKLKPIFNCTPTSEDNRYWMFKAFSNRAVRDANLFKTTYLIMGLNYIYTRYMQCIPI